MSLLWWCLLFSCISVGFLRGTPALPFWTTACAGSSFYPLRSTSTLIVSLTKTCMYYRCTHVHVENWVCHDRTAVFCLYCVTNCSDFLKRSNPDHPSACIFFPFLHGLLPGPMVSHVSLKFMSPLTSVLAHTWTGNRAHLLHWSQQRWDK